MIANTVIANNIIANAVIANSMIAVVPVREGVLTAGGEEAVAEAGGRAVLVGDGAVSAALQLAAANLTALVWETAGFQPGAWANALAPRLASERVIILPASPDGRDLAPRLAHALGRQLLAGAVQVDSQRVVLARHNGQVNHEMPVSGPIVTTLQPGARGVETTSGSQGDREVEVLNLALPDAHDAELLEVLPPDPATVDLSEAIRIVSGGLGLGDEKLFRRLADVAHALGASFGGTRAASDRGWVPAERFIGTTGVHVNPDLYIALGISGAVQHTSGLGRPKHIISVNLDAGCPMMAIADLAIVSDARAVIEELAARLGLEVSSHG